MFLLICWVLVSTEKQTVVVVKYRSKIHEYYIASLSLSPSFVTKTTKSCSFPLPPRALLHHIHMEPLSSKLVHFPLLVRSNYIAGTIPYRLPSDDPLKPTPTELSWINLLLGTIPSFKFAFYPFFVASFQM